MSIPNLSRNGVIAALVAVASIGCGEAGPAVTPVNGKVVLDGQPVKVGFVLTLPPAGRGAKGIIQPDGSFTLGTFGDDDGALNGSHKVAVVAYEGGVAPGPEAPPGKLLVPKRYINPESSELTIEVKAGEANAPVLELTSP